MAGAQPIKRDGEKAASRAQESASDSQRITPLRELQLVELHRKGGPRAQEALAELIRAYQKRIYSICLRMVRHPEDAADLTQDALIKVIEGLASYGGQSKLSTWVIRVTINCCLTHLRKQKLRAHESLDASASRQRGISGGVISPDSSASAASELTSRLTDRREISPLQRIQLDQTRGLLLEGLSGLDADMRAILVLRDMQDLDYQQLSEVLEIPIGTVKSRLFRARAALREELERRGGI